MPNTLGRNLNLCFTKIRRPPLSPTPDEEDHTRPFPTATSGTTSTSSSATSMFKNFNSLYDDTIFDSTTTSKSLSCSLISTYDSETDATAPDFASAFASHRFFFSSPGRSNSIVDQSSISSSSLAATSSTTTSDPPSGSDRGLFDHSVAVPTYSPDPYRDFRRSMQEMVEAREQMAEEEKMKKSKWEFLHELLLCYLALNPKNTHKFIIGAFADLLVTLMPSPGGLKEPEFTAGVCEISRCVSN